MSQNNPEAIPQTGPAVTPQDTKPRIALMGEFSAGKSTLANLLLEQTFSPVQATATQLPPVWFSYGYGAAHRVTAVGETETVPTDRWASECPSGTKLIMVEHDADILGATDLIDMPGTSDPNLTVDYWEAILPLVDIVIWCTPSNQAWRQSEAALWAEVDPELKKRSVLLVTRMDQIRAEVDRARILHRVEHEAGGCFKAVLPISLTQAMAAPQDDSVLEQSGAADLVRMLIGSLSEVDARERAPFDPRALASKLRVNKPQQKPAKELRVKPAGVVTPRRIVRKGLAASRPDAGQTLRF